MGHRGRGRTADGSCRSARRLSNVSSVQAGSTPSSQPRICGSCKKSSTPWLSPPRQFAVRRVSKDAATPPTSTTAAGPRRYAPRWRRPSSAPASSFTVAQKKSRTVVSRSSIISCPIWPSPSRPRLHRRELRYTHTEPALLCRITLGCKHMPAESTEIDAPSNMRLGVHFRTACLPPHSEQVAGTSAGSARIASHASARKRRPAGA